MEQYSSVTESCVTFHLVNSRRGSIEAATIENLSFTWDASRLRRCRTFGTRVSATPLPRLRPILLGDE